MAAAQAGAPLAAHGVNLVDEDNGGGILLGLLKQVPDPGGAYAHVELHKVRAGDGEILAAGLPGHRPGQQGFAGARRAHQEDALGNAGAQLGILGGLAEKIHHLGQFFLLLVGAGHVGKGGFALLVHRLLDTGLAEAHGLAASVDRGQAAAHHDPHGDENHHDEQRRNEIDNPGQLADRLVIVGDFGILIGGIPIVFIDHVAHVVDEQADIGHGVFQDIIALVDFTVLVDVLGPEGFPQGEFQIAVAQIQGVAFHLVILEIRHVIRVFHIGRRGAWVEKQPENQEKHQRNADEQADVPYDFSEIVVIVGFHRTSLLTGPCVPSGNGAVCSYW